MKERDIYNDSGEEKDMLEKEKLIHEIKNLKFDKWKFWFGFIPLIGVLVTISYNISSLQQEDDHHNQDVQITIDGNYSKIYYATTNFEVQREMANEACNDFRLTEKLRDKWCSKIKPLREKISELKRLDSLKRAVKENLKDDEVIAKLKEINRLDSIAERKKEEIKAYEAANNQAKVEEAKRELNSLENDIDEIINDNSKIKESFEELDVIDKKQNKVIGNPTVAKPELKLITDESSWFKKGYYRQFGNVRISLKDLKNSTATFEISTNDKSGSEKEVIENFTLDEGSKKMIQYDGKLLEFLFQRIGSAGKNPFSKAVYFVYREYEE